MKEKANPLDNRYMLEMSVKKGKRIHFVDYRPSKKMLRHHNAVGSLVDMHIHTHMAAEAVAAMHCSSPSIQRRMIID